MFTSLRDKKPNSAYESFLRTHLMFDKMLY